MSNHQPVRCLLTISRRWKPGIAARCHSLSFQETRYRRQPPGSWRRSKRAFGNRSADLAMARNFLSSMQAWCVPAKKSEFPFRIVGKRTLGRRRFQVVQGSLLGIEHHCQALAEACERMDEVAASGALRVLTMEPCARLIF